MSEKPGLRQQKELWESIRLYPVNDYGKMTSLFMEEVTRTHCNGGIQIHKYRIEGNRDFKWFAERNMLPEIRFMKNIIMHEDMAGYRKDLEIAEKKLKFADPGTRSCMKTNIFTLSGELAEILVWGGAYDHTEPSQAWSLATGFVEEAFQNRFTDVVWFNSEIRPAAQWFYDIAWDYSVFLFDKKKDEITLIDMTDTD